MSVERKMILQMVQEGRITAEEALALLDALAEAAQPEPATSRTQIRIAPVVNKSGEQPRRFWIHRVASPGPSAGPSSRVAVKRVELQKSDSKDLAKLLRDLPKSES